VQNVIRNIFVGAGVLLLSVVIFFLISDEQELKQDVYDHALALLGEQLLAVLPEDAPAAEVTKKWERFSEQAMRGEVPPEQVERVAASILNASNAEEKLSPAEVSMMLDIAITAPRVAAVKSEATGTTASVSVAMAPRAEEARQIPPPSPVLPERYHKLGEELMTVLKFNSQVNERLKQAPQKSEILLRNFHYEFDNGLKIEIDSELKKELSDNAMQKELAVLQKKKIIEWRQGLARDLEELQLERMKQLDSLRSRLEKQAVYLQNLNDAQRQEVLNSLQRLHKLNVVDAATVEQIMTETMHEWHLELQQSEQEK